MAIELTAEQEARADEYIQKWTDKALRTEPIDRSTLPAVASYIYRQYHEECPGEDELHVFDTPEECWEYICKRESDSEEEYKENMRSIVFPVIDGAFDASFMSFCDFAKNELGETLTPEAESYLLLQNVNFVWAMPGYCVFCEFPKVLNLDENYDPHCEDGPAIKHGDSAELWYIHGIEVNEKIVMRPETQTIDEIVNEPNNDVREIRIERYGWLRFLQQIDAEVLDEGPNDIEGTWEALYATAYGTKFVACCPTGKIPVLSVPPEVKTCEQARLYFNGGDPNIRILGRT